MFSRLEDRCVGRAVRMSWWETTKPRRTMLSWMRRQPVRVKGSGLGSPLRRKSLYDAEGICTWGTVAPTAFRQKVRDVGDPLKRRMSG